MQDYIDDIVWDGFSEKNGLRINFPFKQCENIIFSILAQRIFDVLMT